MVPRLERRLALLALSLCALGSGALQAQRLTYHVSTAGSDANAGSPEGPFRTIRKAVKAARPGDTILVHAGTYDGIVEIDRSGAPGKPITLGSAGDGPVVLRAALPTSRCTDAGPTLNRTVQVRLGVDHWIIRDLEIVGGILISGTNPENLTRHVWNRGLPGRGGYDPDAARSTLELLGSDGADSIEIVANKIRGRGIWALAARHGRIEGNEIYNIECGTGGGIWLGRFSDGWVVRDNHIHDISASADNHWMSEGIRTAAASRYNIVEENVVERLGGLGRGITMDTNSGWNVARRNQVRQADMGFSEQKGGMGNQWTENTASDNRSYGFSVGPRTEQAVPNDSVPSFLRVSCNVSVNNPVALRLGSVQKSSFENNAFSSIRLSRQLEGYWTSAQNLWDGSSALPPLNPAPPAICPSPPGPTRVWGDVNRDQTIDNADAALVLNHVTGLPAGEIDIGLADVDADSKVTSSDALIILRHAVGLDTRSFRIGTPAS